ncbi:hypothetical protein ACFO5Q_17720 [Kordiimonas lipolytica]|uniref:Tetratricopeptide repeat-containing protein n=1 Tax=Kordiimonas lipolytica TaxID=1662421 RepID=A0ABV8UFI7_9PROT|nr:tetratricopeptide repeat protein [Kordiimonas lipolytica]
MTFSKWRYLSGAAVVAFATACLAPLPVAALQTVPVQGAQQATFARLAFAIPEAVAYSVEHQGTEVSVTAEGDISFDLSQIDGSQLRQVRNPRTNSASGQTIVTFTVPEDANVRHFRSGQFLVVDVYSENIVAEGAPQPVAQPQTQVPAQADAQSETADVSQPVSQQPTSDTPGGADGSDNATAGDSPEGGQESEAAGTQPAQEPVSGVDSSEPQEDEADARLGSDDGVTRDITAAEPEADNTNDSDPVATTNTNVTDVVPENRVPMPPQQNVTVTGSEPEGEPVPVSVSAIENGIKLRFQTPEGVAAAAFERGGFLWLVFDRQLGVRMGGLRANAALVGPRIRNIELVQHRDALVMRLSIRTDQSTVVEKDRNDWLVSLKDTPAKPRFPLVPERQTEGTQGQQIHIPATDLGRKIEVEDPAVGDLLVVVPTLLEGRGLPQQYSYASSEVLETSQGIVVVPLSDFVTVERFADGVTIRSAGNDILSASKLSRGTGIGDQLTGNFNRLIDFKAWRIGNDWEYRKNKSRLLYELSLRPASDRNEVRWKLARYFLAHGRGEEALGIMERMLDEDPLLTENSEYLAVRGVANFKAGRLDEAAADLSARGLEAEQDAELWRALVAEARGNYEQALEHYRRGKDVMGTYDDYDRAEIQLAVIRSSLALGNIEQAQRELDLLNGLSLTSEQISESVFQSARIAERQGQLDMALAQYDDLSDVPQRWIAARARYARIKYSLRMNDITQQDGIDQLERLRYAWRGNRFEIQLLDDLADLYFQTKQYRLGLETLRQGISYFPDLASERQMISRSSQVFRQLFLDGDADDMTPISAISLYYDFRDLTPLGNDGDLMIRRLASRLVSVDLLDRAAELLEYQVRVRTEGAARAAIAARLAQIHILDEKPEQALQILRGTREPRLPQDIEASRRHVEARALIELSRYEEAEVVLDGDRSNTAEYLRADIYWGDKNWPQLASTVRRVLGDGWRRNEALNDKQRLNLIRLTIALTFTEDRAGLIEMRRRYGQQMREGDFANAFELLTNDQELSGRELGAIASQIASVEKLQSFMREYRNDFSGG